MSGLLVLLFIFYSLQTQVIQGDTAFVLTTNSAPNGTLLISTLTRGREGFSFVCIHQNETNYKDGMMFIGYATSSSLIVNLYNMSENFEVQNILYNNTLFVESRDRNEYPYNRFYKAIFLNVLVNRTIFGNRFKNDFAVTVGFSWDRYPTDPSLIRMENLEKYTFRYNISTETGRWPTLLPINRRYEYFHLAIYIIWLIALAFIGVLVVLFSFKQPLKSRGIIPFLTVLIQFIDLFVGFPHFFFPLSTFSNNCAIIDIIERPLRSVLFILSLLHFFRYVTIINLTKQKVYIISNRKEGSRKGLSIFLLLLRYMGTWWFDIIVTVLSYLIFTFIFSMAYFANNFQCTGFQTNEINYWVYIGLLIALGGGYILIFLYDFFINIRDIIRCRFYQLFVDDIYYFRIEIYIFGILVTYLYTSIWQLHHAINNNPTLIAGICNGIFFNLFLFYQVIFVLVFTIFKTIYDCLKRKPKDELEEILKSEEKRSYFRKFCQQEFSPENLACYEDINEYKSKNQEEKAKIATQIFNLYVRLNAELEVNFPGPIRNEINEKIQNGVFEKDLFDKLEVQIIVNLSDTYSRFVYTQEYDNLLKKETFIKRNLSIIHK